MPETFKFDRQLRLSATDAFMGYPVICLCCVEAPAAMGRLKLLLKGWLLDLARLDLLLSITWVSLP